MKKTISILVVIVMILSMASLAGCGSSSGGTVSEIKIGLVCPVSGSAAVAGEYIKNGISLVTDELNAAGGLEVKGKKIPVKLIIEDNEGTPEKTTNVYRKLIDQDKVLAIVGPDMSKCILAGGPIAQSAKIPAIGTFTTNEKVTQIGDFLFRACFIDPFQGEVAAKYALNTVKAKTAAILYNNADDYAKGLQESFRKVFEANGGKIVESQAYGSEIKDYNVQLSKIKASNPDVIFLPNLFTELGLQVKQAREMGITAKIVGGDSFDTPDVPKIAGFENAEGISYISAFSADDTSPAAKAFTEKFKAKFKVNPNSNAVLAYEAYKLVLKGIQDAEKLDGQGIRDAMAKIKDYELPSGKITFDANRNPIKGATILKINKNGEPVYETTVNP